MFGKVSFLGWCENATLNFSDDYEHLQLSKNRDRLKIHFEERDHERTIRYTYRFHIMINFFHDSKPKNSSGTLKLQARYLQGNKTLSLSAINWDKSEMCSSDKTFVEKESNETFDSSLLVWINAAGQLNVVQDGKKASLTCLIGPWSDPIKIKVTGINMRPTSPVKKTLDDLFDIRYEVDQIISE